MSEKAYHEYEQTNYASEIIISLKNSIDALPADALLLSGGIDSSLLASLDPKIPSFTVGLKGESLDIPRVQEVATIIGSEWQGIEISTHEATDLLDELIYLKKSYDPGMINDIATYKASTVAMSQGLRQIRTGDAADTLFAGYSYFSDIANFTNYLETLMPHFFLSPTKIGRQLNIQYSYPYLSEEVRNLAISIPYDLHTENTLSTQSADFHNKEEIPLNTISQQRWGKNNITQSHRTIASQTYCLAH